MSTRSKGNNYEKEVKDIFEADGFVVEKALPRLVWLPGRRFPISSSHDFFGAWDLVAKKAGSPTVWIQVSVIEHLSSKIKQVRGFPHTDGVDICAIYGRVRGGLHPHFRVHYAGDNYEWKGATALILKKKKK